MLLINKSVKIAFIRFNPLYNSLYQLAITKISITTEWRIKSGPLCSLWT